MNYSNAYFCGNYHINHIPPGHEGVCIPIEKGLYFSSDRFYVTSSGEYTVSGLVSEPNATAGIWLIVDGAKQREIRNNSRVWLEPESSYRLDFGVGIDETTQHVCFSYPRIDMKNPYRRWG